VIDSHFVYIIIFLKLFNLYVRIVFVCLLFVFVCFHDILRGSLFDSVNLP